MGKLTAFGIGTFTAFGMGAFTLFGTGALGLLDILGVFWTLTFRAGDCAALFRDLCPFKGIASLYIYGPMPL